MMQYKLLGNSGLKVSELCMGAGPFPMGSKPNQSGLGRKHMLESVAASLQRLRTDYVDILYAHAWDDNTPLSEKIW